MSQTMSKTLYDSQTVQFMSIDMRPISRYLIENIQQIAVNDTVTDSLLKQSQSGQTPQALLLQALSDIINPQNVLFINANRHMSSVPEVLTSPNLVIDVKQLENEHTAAYDALSTSAILKDKLIINISDLQKDPRQTTISDYSRLSVSVLRSLLSRSYYQSQDTTWLSPKLCSVIAKTYSMTISTLIASQYQLDFDEQHVVQILLSAFLAQRLMGCEASEDELKLPPLMKAFSANYLGIYKNITDTLEEVEEFMTQDGKVMSPQNLLDAIHKVSPQRLNRLTYPALTSMISKWGPTDISSRIAIDYPPYWVSMMVSAVSKQKIGLYFQLKKHKRLPEEVMGFVKDLIKERHLEKI